MPTRVVFESPEPVPVMELPWFADVQVADGPYEELDNVPGFQPTLAYLSGGPLGEEGDELRTATLNIGKRLMAQGFITAGMPLTMRSGLYGTQDVVYERLGFHYDRHPVSGVGVIALVITNSAGSEVAVGSIKELFDGGELCGPNENFTAHQALIAETGETVYDVSEADVVQLEPNVLYMLPAYCVHACVAVDEPVARNFVRFKVVEKGL